MSLKDISSSFDGLLIDLLFIGVLGQLLTNLNERRQTIKRYREEIEDFLGWKADEAKYRIVGNIKRLNREGVSKINLKRAYLQGAVLGLANLQGAILWKANLQGADLFEANLQGAVLGLANLQGAILWKANLQGADLSGANLRGTELLDINLQGADLYGAELDEIFLQGAELLFEDIIMPDGSKHRYVKY